MLKNFEVAWLFFELADRLEVLGENRFKILAYRKAARAIESLPEPVEALFAKGELLVVPGIGAAINAKIGELLETGEIKLLSRLRREIPPGVMEMLTIPGVGPRLAGLFYQQLGLADIEALREAAKARRLRDVKGLGAKIELNVLRGIDRLQRGPQRLPLGIVLPIARTLCDGLRHLPEAARVEVAGSLRRSKDAIGDIDILVASDDQEAIMSYFTALPQVREVLASGGTKASVLHHSGVQVDLRVVPPNSFPAAWQYFTGSKEHNTKLRKLAKGHGFRLSEYGLFPVDGSDDSEGPPLRLDDEADLYRRLSLAYIPPELREDLGEIEAAGRGELPELVDVKEIRGDLHLHSQYSDGVATLEELARAAAARGYEYVAVCDHSRSLAIARGLDEARLGEQGKEIARINGLGLGATLLRGIEVDILSDGRLDLPDEVLSGLDVVVASVHSGFKQEPEQLLRRVESAMRNDHVDILAHPSGRLIGRREAYGLDLAAVLDLAAQTGTAVEVNASPDRLDLADIWIRRAVELGVPITVDTDAHSLEQFDYMEFGVSTARRGWAAKSDVLNTLPLSELQSWLTTPKRERRR